MIDILVSVHKRSALSILRFMNLFWTDVACGICSQQAMIGDAYGKIVFCDIPQRAPVSRFNMLRNIPSIFIFVTAVYSSKNNGALSHASFWRTCGVMLLIANFLSFLPNQVAVLMISNSVVFPVPVVPVMNSPGKTVLFSFHRFIAQHAIL